MKKKYHFDNNNIKFAFTGTYKKLDNLQPSNICELKEIKYYSFENFDLSKKCNQTQKLSNFIKSITQFFTLKEKYYSNGSKNCSDEFIFDNKF